MRALRVSEIIEFALARKNGGERMKYLLLAIIFYPFLVRDILPGSANGDSGTLSQAGDDIYPLF